MATRLPDFLIIGAMRAGTTTVYRDLGAHPQVFMPEDKEPDILCTPLPPGVAQARFARLFAPAGEGQVCGEGSTSYAKLPHIAGVPERALEVIGPALKIIYLVRDPIQRIVSQHHHELGTGQTKVPLDAALAVDPRFLDYSRYAMQIRPWLELFGRRQVRLVPFEDYMADREAGQARLLTFLGLDPAKARPPSPERFNAAAGRPTASGGWRRLVHDRQWYRAYVKPRLPRGLRRGLGRLLLPRAPAEAQWPSRDTLARLRESLAPEVEGLRALFPEARLSWPDFPQHPAGPPRRAATPSREAAG